MRIEGQPITIGSICYTVDLENLPVECEVSQIVERNGEYEALISPKNEKIGLDPFWITDGGNGDIFLSHEQAHKKGVEYFKNRLNSRNTAIKTGNYSADITITQ